MSKYILTNVHELRYNYATCTVVMQKGGLAYLYYT